MAGSEGETSAREELLAIAGSLRAYLEWQLDTGAAGIPRRPRSAASPASVEEQAFVNAPARVPEEPEESKVAVAPPPPVAIAVPAPAPPAAVAAQKPVAKPIAPARPLSVVAAEAKGCTKCGLAATRTNVVFSRGNPAAKICFIGEAPGADEDEQGLPFVGRAGQLLDKMIRAMSLDPEKDVYVCNIIKCRPPGNRRPEPVEVETCIPYLHEQIAIVAPKVIVAMGNTAASALLGSTLGITKMRGQWKLYRGRVPVMPTYHPSYLLRPSPQQVESKRQAWEDLQAVMKELGIARPGTSA